MIMQGVDEVDDVAGVARKEEVGPVDPLVGPGRPMAAAEPTGAEIEAILW
jgi:hypothetical protein